MTTPDYWRRRPVRPTPSPFWTIWDQFERRLFLPAAAVAAAWIAVHLIRAYWRAYFGG